MRVLLDTNIIIYRENKRITNYSVTHLFRWLDMLKCDKLIHPLSRQELARYTSVDPSEAMTLKLDAYNELRTIAPLAHEVEALANLIDRDENDRVDTALLNEVFQGRVDLLITEDRKLRNKAERLGIANKVISINSFISDATAENPTLIEYKTLAVKKMYFGDIDINDAFFDSFRDSYDGFNRWFAKKCDEEAYICQDDSGIIVGFLYVKTEIESENYSDILPQFQPKKRLKVGTFKVESTGFRLGERFIKTILDNALERNVDEIYVTMFEDRDDLVALANLLKRWGFDRYGEKTSNGKTEAVLTKAMKFYNPALTPRQNYPNMLFDKQKFILPIYPQYHTSLFPDSILNNENESDFLAKTPYRYALQKVYISWAYENNINPGDIVLFYRTGVEGNKKHTSVLTTVSIVDEVISEFATKDQYLNHCQNRSVFTIEELEYFWKTNRRNLKVIKFVYVKSLTRRPILDFLWENDIVEAGNGPRPFTRITDTQFDLILNESDTDLYKYWR